MPSRCIVIAQGLPNSENGFGLAMISSLKLYASVFDHVLYLVLSDRMGSDSFPLTLPASVEYRHIYARHSSRAIRFLRSVASKVPACVQQMKSYPIQSSVFAAISESLAEDENTCCIVENLAPSVLIPRIRRNFPGLRLVYRSHDVSGLAFAPFASEGSLPSRLMWQFEISRIHALERAVLGACDLVWAITDTDADEIRGLYGRECDGVADVRIDVGRYRNVSSGAWDRILYLGSSDFRKARGLYWFLDECWPRIRSVAPDMEFCIGGKGTEFLNGYAPGVVAVGGVSAEDEIEFLGRGRYFLNPQQAGSGIKLKSLVALSAGKVLISTSNGVAGIRGGEAGKHFLVADGPAAMEQRVRMLLSDHENSNRLAKSGSALASANYDLADYDRSDRQFSALQLQLYNLHAR